MIRYAKIAGVIESTRNFGKQAKHLKRAILFCLIHITKFGVGIAMRMIQAKWFYPFNS